MTEERLSIDGTEVRFMNAREDALELVTGDGKALGRLLFMREANAFRAETPDGRLLQQPSRWGGTVTARFGSRELGARALLDEEEKRRFRP